MWRRHGDRPASGSTWLGCRPGIGTNGVWRGHGDLPASGSTWLGCTPGIGTTGVWRRHGDLPASGRAFAALSVGAASPKTETACHGDSVTRIDVTCGMTRRTLLIRDGPLIVTWLLTMKLVCDFRPPLHFIVRRGPVKTL